MPFRPKTREFWLTVVDGKCQYEQYTEKTGFKECGARANHIHHIIPEGDTLLHGGNPEENIALPLCKDHHVKNVGDVLGDPEASFHPDMGQAFSHYKEWKANEQHMMAITGRRTINYSTSPFAEAAKGHRELAKEGLRYVGGDEGTDQHYIEKMTEKATRYLAEHPETVKPHTKPHPQTDVTKRPKRWYDV